MRVNTDRNRLSIDQRLAVVVTGMPHLDMQFTSHKNAQGLRTSSSMTHMLTIRAVKKIGRNLTKARYVILSSLLERPVQKWLG